MSFLPRLLVGLRRRALSFSTVPRIGVRLLAATADDRVLLVRQTYSEGWQLPGGGLKTGETTAEGAMREAWEETGCRIGSVDGLLGVYANFGVGWSDHVVVHYSRDIAIPPDFPVVPPSRFEIAQTGLFDLMSLPTDICPATARRVDEWAGRYPVAAHW